MTSVDLLILMSPSEVLQCIGIADPSPLTNLMRIQCVYRKAVESMNSDLFTMSTVFSLK